MVPWRVALVGVSIFFAVFSIATGYLWFLWQRSDYILPACDYNLKALWVVARHCSVKYRLPFPPPQKVVQNFVDSGTSIFVTPRIASYLDLPFPEGSIDFRGAFLCARDPSYLLKMAQMTQGLAYEPSYQWHPDAKTLAYCPYCRLAVLMDGKLEKR